jgi:hypothetical protein
MDANESRPTRAQQRAAGTNNTALFDIVNTTTANGSLRAPDVRASELLILSSGEAAIRKLRAFDTPHRTWGRPIMVPAAVP